MIWSVQEYRQCLFMMEHVQTVFKTTIGTCSENNFSLNNWTFRKFPQQASSLHHKSLKLEKGFCQLHSDSECIAPLQESQGSVFELESRTSRSQGNLPDGCHCFIHQFLKQPFLVISSLKYEEVASAWQESTRSRNSPLLSAPPFLFNTGHSLKSYYLHVCLFIVNYLPLLLTLLQKH